MEFWSKCLGRIDNVSIFSNKTPGKLNPPVPASSPRRRANSSSLDVTRPALAVIRPLAPVAAAIVASTTRNRDADIFLMVVGSSCSTEDTQDTSECVLVGLFFYRHLSEPSDKGIIARDYFYHSFKRYQQAFSSPSAQIVKIVHRFEEANPTTCTPKSTVIFLSTPLFFTLALSINNLV